MREQIFSSKRRKTESVEVFGITIEVRQPSLGDVLDLQDLDTQKARVANALINYCYVPDTAEKVFEVADVDSILAMPFDENLEKIQTAITKLTGINMKETEGNLEETTDDTTS